jgi:hypothetical protein
MAGGLFIVSRTKPGTYTYMKLVSESEDVVISTAGIRSSPNLSAGD